MRVHIARSTILAAGAAAALVLAPAAQATDADAQFLAVVTELGLQFDTPEDAVEAGNNVCDIVAEGAANNADPARIRGDIMNSLLGEGVNHDQATRLMVGAVGAYCPVYNGIVTG
ncbi:DUF732 domain-containing protein [Mycobacterium sp. 236(2023)]|uniref:DUF732 domain-containing protein n=1 Tax=Mycobacterium sp. 236(2023) TaxID=3038163 RepID=UPI0024156544|nr:DUF732 domain-containing protein [Mycobacterium sp. 236(2023)]MDG4665981.1 DUF732 domain-containing protein [Mycobacterium sp. 236(2023)]